jgi:hypothetical protein
VEPWKIARQSSPRLDSLAIYQAWKKAASWTFFHACFLGKNRPLIKSQTGFAQFLPTVPRLKTPSMRRKRLKKPLFDPEPGDVSYEDATESMRAVLDRGLAYLEAKGISAETAHQCGIQFGSVDYDLILERLGTIDQKWANACVAIWIPCQDSTGKLIGWMAEAVPGN